jgi:tRNA-dihydrouridine synthase
MLTIHGRTTKEMSKVPAHWDVIGQCRELRDQLSPSTLLVGNGDVRDYQHAHELAQQYDLDGIMIGRGVFDDPYVFAKQSPWAEQTKEQKTALFLKHINLYAETWHNNERRLPTLNKFCKIYINGFDGAKDLRERLLVCQTVDELRTTLTEH